MVTGRSGWVWNYKGVEFAGALTALRPGAGE